MRDWDEVVSLALSLPGTALSTSYGQPAVKVRDRMFVSRSREEDSFHVRAGHDEKAVLMETDPDTFWQTPHYANWPGLLVRMGTAERDRIGTVITRAWWDAASKAQRTAFGPRP